MMLYIIPYLFYSVLAAIAIILQADMFSYMQILNVSPDLLLIITALAGIKTGKENGAAVGTVVGFWADLLIGSYFGVHILVYALIGYLFGLLGERFNLRNYLGYFFTALFASLISGLLFLIAYGLVGSPLSFWQNFGGIVLPTAFYNSLLMLLSFPFVFIYRKFRGLKIGYVDMYGGGIIFITNNELVDFSYVEKRKAELRSHRHKKGTGKSKSVKGKLFPQEDRNNNDNGSRGGGSRKKAANKKSRPTFNHKDNHKSVKKKKSRSRDYDQDW